MVIFKRVQSSEEAAETYNSTNDLDGITLEKIRELSVILNTHDLSICRSINIISEESEEKKIKELLIIDHTNYNLRRRVFCTQ